jgi:hypothetical protein
MKYKYRAQNLRVIFVFLSFILVILSFLFKKNKKIRVYLCVIGKNENIYAKEYVNHYKSLGYDHIFIYDNNDFNGEKFSDIIKEEINQGFVSIINYIGYRGNSNNTKKEAYIDCYKKNRKHYHWLSFFDFDEYLELKPQNETIQQFLKKKDIKIVKILK